MSGLNGGTEISLDNVLNTGENENREENTLTPEEIAAAAAASDEGDADEGDAGEGVDKENQDNLKGLLGTFRAEENLNDEDKQTRTDLLAKYKGEGFDEDGNIVDKDGNTVADFDTIFADLSEEDTLTVDADGNEVNAEGTVIRTAVEIAIDTTVVNKLHSESEYEFLDDKGNTKIYSDDNDGIKDFTKDLASQQLEEFKEEYFAQNPKLLEISKHIISGGTIEDFKEPVDYSKLDLATMTKEEKTSHVRQSYLNAGLSADQVNGLITMFTDANTIDAEAAKAIPLLQAGEAKAVADRDKAYNDSIVARNERVEAHWNEVQAVVTKGDLGDIKVPEAEKAEFFKYLSSAVDSKGNSKEFLDRQSETKEQALMASYLRFKGFDLSKLVDVKAKATKIKSLKDRMRASAKQKQTIVNKSNQNQNSDKDITIDALLG